MKRLKIGFLTVIALVTASLTLASFVENTKFVGPWTTGTQCSSDQNCFTRNEVTLRDECTDNTPGILCYYLTTTQCTTSGCSTYFTFSSAIIEGVKKDAKEKLDKLFTISDSDNDIEKSLKSQPTQGLKDDFEIDYKVDQIVWSVDLCEYFFLKKYYKIIDETLKSRGLTLSDLNEEG